jgi:phosphoribosylformylglycinamidine cyclo-ligase
LCRALADRLPQGYLTQLPDGRSYGETLLDASVIYASFIAALREAKLNLHYAVHMTGHGWRKLMRLDEPFVYRINDLRPAPPIFDFIQTHGQIDPREMYATFNMGVGFAVFVAPRDAPIALNLAHSAGYAAWVAGVVARDGARKAVEIDPLNITFEAETLQVR